MAVFSTLVLLSQELLTLAVLMCVYVNMCVCVCMSVCAHIHMAEGWERWVTTRSLAAPCTNFKLPSFLSHYTYTHTYTFTHTPHMFLIAEDFQGSMVQIGCLPGGNPTPEAWVSAFATLPFIHQQLNSDYNLPYAFSPLPFLYHYTFL